MDIKFSAFSVTLSILVSVIIIQSNGQSFVSLTTVGDILSVTKESVKLIAKGWKVLDRNFNVEEIPIPLLDRAEEKIISRLKIINRKLDALQDHLTAEDMRVLVEKISNIIHNVRFELRLHDLLDYMTRVDVLYELMQKYVENRKSLGQNTLEDFAKNTISHDSGSIMNLLERIHAFIVPSGRGITNYGILSLLRKEFEAVLGEFCSLEQSPQQILYKLYQSIALTELKGYSMIQFSYMLLKLYGQGNYTKEGQLTRDRFEERTNEEISSIRLAMENASRELWKCDPKQHIAGATYVEVTELIQGYIQNEVDLNEKGECWGNCATYTYTKSHGCYQNLFCRKQKKCNGKILHCQFVDSDMDICMAPDWSNRRYEYVEYENGRVLGRKMGCQNGKSKVDSWWRYLFWHCSYCFCLCDDQGPNSDRYINLRPAMANISHNYVVTGLKFTKKNRIIHLQIQEGQLLPHGNIDPKTVRWVPVDDYKITDQNVHSGRDYHTFTWEKRAIDLDDLHANASCLITGVRFKLIGTHLNFEVFMSPFDFESGQLTEPLQKSGWKDNPNTDASLKNPRKKVKLLNPDVPTRNPQYSLPDSEHDSYIELTQSDMDRDASQTTVPFFDAQPVESITPVPLSGAGIYHKGRINFGGFIAPKVYTYDYTNHLQAAFPPTEEDFVN